MGILKVKNELGNWVKVDDGRSGVDSRYALSTAAAPIRRPIRYRYTNPYTVKLTDENAMMGMAWGADATVILPSNAAVPFPLGAEIEFFDTTATGIVIFTAGPGATVSGVPGLRMTAKNTVAKAKKVGTDGWVVYGQLAV